jgi:hypothetical protein
MCVLRKCVSLRQEDDSTKTNLTEHLGTLESDSRKLGRKISHELHEWIPEFV